MLTHHTAVQIKILARDELIKDLGPGGVAGHIIPFGGDGLNLPQIETSNVREIMMLIMKTNVVNDPIERTIVTVGLLAVHKLIMLGDEVTRDGVENAQAHEETTDKVEKGLPSEVLDYDDIKRDLDQPVDKLVEVHGEGVHKEGPQRIEEWLIESPEELAELMLEQVSLESGGQIDIDTGDTLRCMVIKMIPSEGGHHSNTNGEIKEERKYPVVDSGLEEHIVRQLVTTHNNRMLHEARYKPSSKDH
mmetsp:Transcript_18420/g.15722  ORF Transcript_18420/g.15722 Transcript_18420/m.15722 type:complete len:247 (-) Transcript_18420:320-1060(-)